MIGGHKGARVHHDWPTFLKSHIQTPRQQKYTHIYNNSHVFHPFFNCRCLTVTYISHLVYYIISVSDKTKEQQYCRIFYRLKWTFNFISLWISSLSIPPKSFLFILHLGCPLCPSSTIFLFPLLPEGSVGHTVCPSLSLHVLLPPSFHPLSQSNILVQSFIFPPSSVDTLLGSLSRENC